MFVVQEATNPNKEKQRSYYKTEQINKAKYIYRLCVSGDTVTRNKRVSLDVLFGNVDGNRKCFDNAIMNTLDRTRASNPPQSK